MRFRYLMCYDIRDDIRLRRTAKVAEAFGSRLNYSVFLCDLTEVEVTRFETELRNTIDYRVDSVLIVNLGPIGPATDRRLRWLCGGVRVQESGSAVIV